MPVIMKTNFPVCIKKSSKMFYKILSIKPTGRRSTDEIKQFALILNFYFPKAYNSLRKYLHLPHTSPINPWIASVYTSSYFLSLVFEDLRINI